MRTNARAKELFLDALSRPDVDRVCFLADACAGDDDLRRQVEDLLDAHGGAGRFLGGHMPVEMQGSRVGLAARGERRSVAEGARIDQFRLTTRIGEGGFGEVWMAEQEAPVARRVALKIIKPGMDTRGVIARFEAERQALALMDHPCIARVFDAGATDGGRPYFVMELVSGDPITEFCDRQRATVRQRLDLFMHVCRAVQHAHQKGIIHRDLKPSNILVTGTDGQPLPKVIDFGIAKATGEPLTDQTIRTEVHQLIGTPQYMSPEQAEPGSCDIDTRSDIYSLGVLLYELLTGTTPIEGRRLRALPLAEVQRLIREEEPPRPSLRLATQSAPSSADRFPTPAPNLSRDVPTRPSVVDVAHRRRSEPTGLTRTLRGDLDWIVMKCLEKDRRRRYESASALAEDVQHYLEHLPVSACPPSARYKIAKFARRHRAAVIAASLSLAALLAGVAGTSAGMIWAIREQSRAEGEARNARSAERIAKVSLGDAYLAQARATRVGREVGHRERSLEVLARAVGIHDSLLDLRNEAIASLAREDLVVEASLPLPPGAQFDRAVVGAGCVVHTTVDGRLLVQPRFEDPADVYVIPPSEPDDEVGDVRIAPDGRFLAVIHEKRFSRSPRLRLWDMAQRNWRWEIPFPGQFAVFFDFNVDGQSLAVSHPDRFVRHHRIEDGSVIREIDNGFFTMSLLHARVGSTSPMLLITEYDQIKRRVFLHNLDSGESSEFSLPSEAWTLGVSPDGRWLAVGCRDSRIYVYPLEIRASGSLALAVPAGGPPHAILSGHRRPPRRLRFSADGDTLYSDAADSFLFIWDVPRGRQRFAPVENSGVVGSHNDRIAWAEESGVTLRSLQASPVCRTLRSTGHVAALIDHRLIAVGGRNGIELIDATTGLVEAVLGRERVQGLAAVSGGLLAATSAGLVRWSIDTGTRPAHVSSGNVVWPHRNLVDRLVVSSDGRHAFVADGDDQVWRVPLDNPMDAAVFATQLGARPMHLSADGRRLVVGNWAGREVGVYSVDDGRRLFSLDTPGSGHAFAEFAAQDSGAGLLIVGLPDEYRFLDAETYSARHSIRRSGWLAFFAAAPDGRTALIARTGSNPLLIDLHTFEDRAVLTPPEPASLVGYSTFDPRGERLLMHAGDDSHLMWDVGALRARLGALALDWN